MNERVNFHKYVLHHRSIHPDIVCCTSCHDDSDELGYDLLFVELGECGACQFDAEVCCSVARYIGEHPEVVEKYLDARFKEISDE